MKIGFQEVDWAGIGAALAVEGSPEQTAFFKAFCKELLTACGTLYRAEKQLAWVNHDLTTQEREQLSMLSFEPPTNTVITPKAPARSES